MLSLGTYMPIDYSTGSFEECRLQYRGDGDAEDMIAEAAGTVVSKEASAGDEECGGGGDDADAAATTAVVGQQFQKKREKSGHRLKSE